MKRVVKAIIWREKTSMTRGQMTRHHRYLGEASMTCERHPKTFCLLNVSHDSVKSPCNAIKRASDVSTHFYHRSRNVLYLGCVKLLFWVFVNFLMLSLLCVSNEEPQMSSYNSITAVAISSSWVCKAAVLSSCQF
ncbi:hypothetical protein LAZ67_4000279 [Cordylochernes scorpioides]|uniref:Ribosomal protein L33 n=1 Tax=Cordylochernes scorpioides TaxID=51811 RepID=A0ABY6KB73_9ARAC|nr:hypothetical protein LAZ67_4000279 [Cordylochernes scorpioides]